MTKIQILIESIEKARTDIANVGKQIQGLKQTGNEVSAAMSGAKVNISSVLSALGPIGAAVTAAFSVTAIIGFIKHVLEANKALVDMAEELGISSQKLGALRTAAELGNISAQKFGQNMRTLAQNISEAADPASRSAAAMRALGLAQSDLTAGTITITDVMDAAAKVFPKWADGANKSALSAALFGREGSRWIPILNQGNTALDAGKAKFDEQAEASKEAAKAQDEFEKALSGLNQTMSGLALQIGSAFLPVLTEMVNQIAAFARSDVGIFAFELLKAAVQATAVAIRIVVLDLEKMVAVVGGIARVASHLVSGDFKGAVDEVKTIGREIVDLSKQQAAEIVGLFTGKTEAAKKYNAAVKGGSADQLADAPNLKENEISLKGLIEQKTTAQLQYQLALLEAERIANESNADTATVDAMSSKSAAAQLYLDKLKAINEQIRALAGKDPSNPALKNAAEQGRLEAAQVQNTINTQKQIRDAERQINQQRLTDTSNMFGNMAQAAKAFGKEGFAAYQAFAIAAAVVDTAKAAIAAYSAVVGIPYVGPILAPIAAAAAIAAGAAQIAAITSASPSFASGGYTGDGGKYEAAGTVHRGEVVIPSETVSNLGPAYFNRYMPGGREGVPTLHAGFSSMPSRGYAGGGFVDGNGSSDTNVHVAFVNSRQEQREFQAREGVKMTIDYMRRRNNRISG